MRFTGAYPFLGFVGRGRGYKVRVLEEMRIFAHNACNCYSFSLYSFNRIKRSIYK